MTENIVHRIIEYISKLNLAVSIAAICMLCLPFYTLLTPVTENMTPVLTRAITSPEYHDFVYDLLTSHTTIIFYIVSILMIGILELVLCHYKKIPPTETEDHIFNPIANGILLLMSMVGVLLLSLSNAMVFFTPDQLISVVQPARINLFLIVILFGEIMGWPLIYGIIRDKLQKKYSEVEA